MRVFPNPFEVSFPLWSLSYCSYFWEFTVSKLGNVGTYRTVCMWYATDLGSGSSMWCFSLYTMEHWLVNLVKFPIFVGSNTRILFPLLSSVLFLNVGSWQSRNQTEKKNIMQVSGCNSLGYLFMLVTEGDGTWSLHRFHLAPNLLNSSAPSLISDFSDVWKLSLKLSSLTWDQTAGLSYQARLVQWGHLLMSGKIS